MSRRPWIAKAASAAAVVAAWPQQTLMVLVQGYRLLLKPWLGQACRFEPTCSAYTLAALQRHGAMRGSALGAWRLLRCHPWCDGGHDAVPENPPRLLAVLTVSSATGLFTRWGTNTEMPTPDRPAAPSPIRKTP